MYLQIDKSIYIYITSCTQLLLYASATSGTSRYVPSRPDDGLASTWASGPLLLASTCAYKSQYPVMFSCKTPPPLSYPFACASTHRQAKEKEFPLVGSSKHRRVCAHMCANAHARTSDPWVQWLQALPNQVDTKHAHPTSGKDKKAKTLEAITALFCTMPGMA